jgi:hypothetical protein
MKIAKTTDTSSKSAVYEITREIAPVFKELERKYISPQIEIFYAFRCLPDSLRRKTSRRFSKTENVLYMDICFSQDRFQSMTVDEQRYELSHGFYAYTVETLRKYKVPDLDIDAFLSDLNLQCREIGWLKEEWEVNL